MSLHDFLDFNFNHKNAIKKKRPNGQTGAYGSKMTRPDFYGMVDFIQNGRLRPAVSFLSQPAILSGRTKATTNSAQTRTGIPGRLFITTDWRRCPGRRFMILDLRRYSQAAIYQNRPLRYSGRQFIVTDLRRYLRRQFIKLERRRCLTAAASG